MEDKDKAMEEFFRNSMDQFDEQPSSNVWEGISSQLDNELAWWQKLWMSTKAYLPYLLFLMLFGLYFMYSSNQISTLRDSLSQLENTSDSKHENAKQLKITALQTTIYDLRQLLSEAKSQLAQAQKSAQSAVNHNNNNNNNNNRLAQKLDLERTENSRLKAEILALSQDLAQAQQLLSNFQSEREIPRIAEQIAAIDTRKTLSITPLRCLSRNNFFQGNFNLPMARYVVRQDGEINELTKTKRSRYLVGFTGSIFNTFVLQSDGYNYGSKWGLRQELSLFPRLSLTNSITLNNQEYTIISKGKTIDNQTLVRYPVNIDDSAVVEKIEIRNKYIDVAMGLKYNFLQSSNGNKFFVNPAFKWLLYLPQEYEYGLAQSADLISTRNRYFAYFGSANLSLGMERRLSDNQIFQLSIWGEQSIIPLGQESQYISMFGLQASYLFGK